MGCAGTIVKGMKGMTRAGLAKLGIGAASEEIVAARRDFCRRCPQATKANNTNGKFPVTEFIAKMGLSNCSVCLECGCFIAAKTLIAKESCPLKPPKW